MSFHAKGHSLVGVGRGRKQQLDDFTRERIKTGELVQQLTKHALGPEEIMTASQVAAALGLLRKSLPDLMAAKVSGEVKVTSNDRDEIRQEIAAMLAVPVTRDGEGSVH